MGAAAAAREAIALQVAAWADQARLAETMRAALLCQDARGILAAVRGQDAVLAACGECAAGTAAALQTLCRGLGLPRSAPLPDILSALRAIDAAEPASRLEAVGAEVARAAADARRLAAANMLLLRQGLAFTSFALRCLTAEAAGPGYTASGLPQRPGTRRVVDTIA